LARSSQYIKEDDTPKGTIMSMPEASLDIDPSEETIMAYEDDPTHEWSSDEPTPETDEDALERPDIVLRAVYSVLFVLAISVLESLLAVVVVFQLVYSLVTRQMPSERVQAFANGITAYFYQILRYVTHNDSLLPFPFSDFPTPQQPTYPAYAPPARSSRSEEPSDESV
jgi:hypothetical protein